jgi:cobalt/nickel transport system permease protein
MHIPDGVLSAPVLVAGGVVAAGGGAIGLRRLDDAALARAAVLSAAFFALSLVMIPVGPSSVHLLLSTLMGLLLGAAIFPAVLVGLLLQAMLFGAGGLTTLGVNTVAIAGSGWLAALAVGRAVRTAPPGVATAAGALGGVIAVALTTLVAAAALAASSPDYAGAARLIGLANLPLAAVEAAVTGFAVGFLRRTRPDMLAPA